MMRARAGQGALLALQAAAEIGPLLDPDAKRGRPKRNSHGGGNFSTMPNAARNRYRKIARLLEEARRLVQAGVAAYRSRWIAGREKLRFALRVLIGRPAQRMLEWLREWYRGQYIPPPPNDPNSPIVVISPGHFEKPLLAKCLGDSDGSVGRHSVNPRPRIELPPPFHLCSKALTIESLT